MGLVRNTLRRHSEMGIHQSGVDTSYSGAMVKEPIRIPFASDIVTKKDRNPGIDNTLVSLTRQKKPGLQKWYTCKGKNGRFDTSKTLRLVSSTISTRYSTFGVGPETPLTAALTGVDVFASPAAEPGPDPLATIPAFFSSSPLSS